jgi:hypothetical protein
VPSTAPEPIRTSGCSWPVAPERDLTLRQPTLGQQLNGASLNVDPILKVWKSCNSASAYAGSQDSRSPPVAGPSVRPDGQDEESERGGAPFGARFGKGSVAMRLSR